MQKLFLFFVLMLLFLFFSCKGQSCHNLPTAFKSYKMATDAVKTASFKMEDSFYSDNWISKSVFYSCDSDKGFLIITTGGEGKEYIFKEVEISTWNNFKESEDKGKFYHQHLKGKKKYYFSLN